MARLTSIGDTKKSKHLPLKYCTVVKCGTGVLECSCKKHESARQNLIMRPIKKVYETDSEVAVEIGKYISVI
jgi:hypothetical protein